MRTIKFKGQRVDNGEWVYGNLIAVSKGLEILKELTTGIQVVEDGIFKAVYQVVPESVGQFTGHKDKNGVEIYEGDIISSYWGKRVIEYTASDGIKLAIIYDKPLEGIHQTHEDFRYNSTSISSVIGNIHENPDLLK